MDVSHDGSTDKDVLYGALWRISGQQTQMAGSREVSCGRAMWRMTSPQRRGDAYHVRVLELLDDGDVVELDVEVLVHAL